MTDHDWESVIGRHLDGVATSDEVAGLSEQLESDADTRMLYLRMAGIHAALAADDLDESDNRGSLPDPNVLIAKRRATRRKWPLTVTVLVGVLLIAIMSALPRGGELGIGAIPSFGATLEWTSNIVGKGNDIWSASRDGKTDAVDQLLEKGVRVNSRLPCKELTPLHVAAIYGRPEVAKLLLDKGADVSLVDVEGNTALHMAAFLAHRDVVELLLDRGASVHDRNAMGQTSIDCVSAEWSPALGTLYTELGKKMKQEIDLKRVEQIRPTILNLLREHAGQEQDGTASAKPPDIDLWRAAAEGNVAAIKQHVSANTYLNGKEPFGGSTPLILASVFGKAEAVRVLIDSGADLEIKNHEGGTAIYNAAFFCQPEIVKTLLDKGADVNARNKDGLTPLDVVSGQWNPELESIYCFIYRTLNIELDLEQIKRTRPEVARLLREQAEKRPSSASPR